MAASDSGRRRAAVQPEEREQDGPPQQQEDKEQVAPTDAPVSPDLGPPAEAPVSADLEPPAEAPVSPDLEPPAEAPVSPDLGPLAEADEYVEPVAPKTPEETLIPGRQEATEEDRAPSYQVKEEGQAHPDFWKVYFFFWPVFFGAVYYLAAEINKPFTQLAGTKALILAGIGRIEQEYTDLPRNIRKSITEEVDRTVHSIEGADVQIKSLLFDATARESGLNRRWKDAESAQVVDLVVKWRDLCDRTREVEEGLSWVSDQAEALTRQAAQ